MVTPHLRPKKKPSHLWLLFSITLLLFVTGWYLSLRFGAIAYRHDELIQVLTHPLTNSSQQDVIFDLRLPRSLAAILVGAAMSCAGAIIQGVTRNPIADPGLLGINAGAGLALIIAYALFGSIHYTLVLCVCLIGSLVATLLVFSLAYHKKRGYNQLRLILAGAMVSTLFSAIGQTLVLYFDLTTAVIGWQAGGFVQINWKMLFIIAPFILLGLLISQLLSHQLTILSLNETVSKALGQKTMLITMSSLAVVLLLSGASVALVGSISFIGLIIPHFVEIFVGKNYRLLLPFSAFVGATFLLWVDFITRIINPPAETPISAIISIVGLPCFLWLIRKGRRF
ncbi:FecCD family ABC transporter permease [Streptococcus sp. zg-JUN1979]|uniref:FecCD family ABC transporter permease n=1 Tax=Streptococcus sp. zg-JUN1979 TaxID=3391450 RepID=UPI0039A6A822